MRQVYGNLGFKEGFWKFSDAKGTYLNGLKNGPWITKDGVGKYKKDLKIGEWLEKDGSGNYKDGVRNGEWIVYDPKLNIQTVILWIFPLILFIFGGLLIIRKVFIN